MFGLLVWHAWYAPKWLLTLTWNFERATVRYFSAGTMLRTLISHWHKDISSYQQGTIGNIALAFAWNMISRGIGFVIRVTVLMLYVIVSTGAALIGLAAAVLFLAWPLLAAGAIVIGIRLVA